MPCKYLLNDHIPNQLKRPQRTVHLSPLTTDRVLLGLPMSRISSIWIQTLRNKANAGPAPDESGTVPENGIPAVYSCLVASLSVEIKLQIKLHRNRGLLVRGLFKPY